MKLELCHEIMACLPQGRTLFHYGKDHYAFYLLGRAVGRGTTVARLRQSRFGGLLQKPLVREWMSGLGSGIVRAGDVPELQWLAGGETYRLSLGIWGKDPSDWRYNQVSRRGASLVLHLNHCQYQQRHMQAIREGVQKDPFAPYAHPEAGGLYPTLAWARLDIDLENREALIEELQSDRFQNVEYAVKRALKAPTAETIRCRGEEVKRKHLLNYWERDMKPHAAIWDEAILTAALDFLQREIGIRKVFYHSFEGGCILKGIRGSRKPPRSIYTTLPKRFCFEATEEIPRMITECRTWLKRPAHERREVSFQVLEV